MDNAIRNNLVNKGLRVTPQRVAVLEAVFKLNNHPTAENIIRFIQRKYSNIAIGTVYKVLDTLEKKGILSKVKTDKDVMRYDAILEPHHHLYCLESENIENYFDNELNILLENYFAKHRIPGFEIEDIKLQIIGKYRKRNSDDRYNKP